MNSTATIVTSASPSPSRSPVKMAGSAAGRITLRNKRDAAGAVVPPDLQQPRIHRLHAGQRADDDLEEGRDGAGQHEGRLPHAEQDQEEAAAARSSAREEHGDVGLDRAGGPAAPCPSAGRAAPPATAASAKASGQARERDERRRRQRSPAAEAVGQGRRRSGGRREVARRDEREPRAATSQQRRAGRQRGTAHATERSATSCAHGSSRARSAARP